LADPYIKFGREHVMVKYCGMDMDNCYNHVCQRGLTQEEKDTILAKHNEHRSHVAKGEAVDRYGESLPTAAGMNEVCKIMSQKLIKVNTL
jgi:hypothetical protein